MRNTQNPLCQALQFQQGQHVNIWLRGIAAPFAGTVRAVTSDAYVTLVGGVAPLEFRLDGAEIVAFSTQVKA